MHLQDEKFYFLNVESIIHLFIFRAASKMSSSGPIVSFEVYKHAARYNGLYEWLNNPPQAQVPSSDIHSVIQISQPPSCDQQSIVLNSSENVTVNDQLTSCMDQIVLYVIVASTQRFSRQNSATSTTSNYSNNAHRMQLNLMESFPHNKYFVFQKSARNGCPGMTNNAYRTRPQHDSTTITIQQPIKSRSASTSDIYQNPVDKALTMSLTSLQPSSAPTTVPVHSERYQTSTTSSQRSTMPSHYRNVRPIVIQPSRPTPSPTRRQQQQQQHYSRSHSPSHLYATSNHYHNSALKNALSSEYVLSSTSSSPITDYANLPLIEDHPSAFESSYSSTSSRNILPHQRPFSHNSTQQQFETSRIFNSNPKLREQNSVASTSSRDSPRLSIVAATQESGVMMNEFSGRRFTKKAPPIPPKRHISVSCFYVVPFSYHSF
ncbi:unnamed protein product [Onchocerca flexuosa]|uniref:Ras-associating domain-containing protein n=1 Tax=Onchocerca flexuosa TaxID=387005 RepID=A0A183HC17_9BILA|nr:unnamed protein product [Onchocerca flexuosa]